VNSKPTYYPLLAAIVVVYVAIGVLYAAFTPIWQVPDEPAHYNYIRALAEGRGLPILEPGDYDQEYLNRLTTEGFPTELSVEAVEYEDHQPPLYYLLATPVYWLFGGAVLPLRLLSVLFGALLLIVASETVRAIFPKQSWLGLVTAAFIAFIPQHVAMSAGVNAGGTDHGWDAMGFGGLPAWWAQPALAARSAGGRGSAYQRVHLHRRAGGPRRHSAPLVARAEGVAPSDDATGLGVDPGAAYIRTLVHP